MTVAWVAIASATRPLTGEPNGRMSTSLARRSAERREAALAHVEWLLTALGRRAGLRHARKHLAAYAEKTGASEALRRALVTSEDADEALRLLALAFASQPQREAA